MLEKTESRIKEILADNEDFINIESQLTDMIPENEGSNGIKNINLLLKLQNIVIEVAYLEGLKDGIECQVEKKTKDNVKRWITLDQLDTVVRKSS